MGTLPTFVHSYRQDDMGTSDLSHSLTWNLEPYRTITPTPLLSSIGGTKPIPIPIQSLQSLQSLRSFLSKTETMSRRSKSKNAYQDAYRGIEFRKRPSSGRPGSPHRFFAASYEVHWNDTEPNSHPAFSSHSLTPVVHRHANGLCVVTAGEQLPPSFDQVVFLRQASSVAHGSAAQKRKFQAKMLQGKTGTRKDTRKDNHQNDQPQQQQQQQPQQQPPSQSQDVVHPHDTLCQIRTSTSDADTLSHNDSTPTVIHVPACVWGTILEVQGHAERVIQDPLLNGYIAVILPTGPFPPPKEGPPLKRPRIESTLVEGPCVGKE